MNNSRSKVTFNIVITRSKDRLIKLNLHMLQFDVDSPNITGQWWNPAVLTKWSGIVYRTSGVSVLLLCNSLLRNSKNRFFLEQVNTCQCAERGAWLSSIITHPIGEMSQHLSYKCNIEHYEVVCSAASPCLVIWKFFLLQSTTACSISCGETWALKFLGFQSLRMSSPNLCTNRNMISPGGLRIPL